MKKEISKQPKVALCRKCRGLGRVKNANGDMCCCTQCEGSGRVIVSCEMTVDISPYNPKQ